MGNVHLKKMVEKAEDWGHKQVLNCMPQKCGGRAGPGESYAGVYVAACAMAVCSELGWRKLEERIYEGRENVICMHGRRMWELEDERLVELN